MPIQTIYSPDPKYVSATDILIGDMSDINYEFLVLNRPLILIANDWIKNNWPDIGIKSDIPGLNQAIKKSISNPKIYQSERKKWLYKTIDKPYENSSKRIIDNIIKFSGYNDPTLVFVDGNSIVRKSNLLPLYKQAVLQNRKVIFQNFPKKIKSKEAIYIGVHFEDLIVKSGYKVHLDHGLKGKGAANVQLSINDYKKNNYFPLIDLHVTAGAIGNERTKMQLGPNSNRTWIGGYPKADTIINLNNKKNRLDVCSELNFNPDFPIVTYAPAGPNSFEKPGGSLSFSVLDELDKIAKNNDYNILVKLKNPKKSLIKRTYGFIFKKINQIFLKIN